MSAFYKYTEEKNYLPDSIFMICGENTNACTNCQNLLYSPVVNGLVHDSQRGKVYCPFGMGDSMNQPIYGDQNIANGINMQSVPGWATTTWGHVPQMDPRSLTKIGLTWRTT